MLQSDNYNSPRFLDIETFDVQKVSVGSQQYQFRFFGKVKNIFIGGKMEPVLNSPSDLVSFGAERFNNEQGDTVVRKDAHLVEGEFFGKDPGRFLGEVGSELQSGQDVVFGNAGILAGNFVNAKSGSNEVKNVGNGNSGAANGGLAKTDIAVDSNAFVEHRIEDNKLVDESN